MYSEMVLQPKGGSSVLAHFQRASSIMNRSALTDVEVPFHIFISADDIGILHE